MKLENIPPLNELDKFLSKDDEVILLKDAINKIGKKDIDYFPIGFEVLDNAINGGVTDGQLIVISGRAGEGKTSWCQTLTYNFTKLALPCLWFSYEVDINNLWQKFERMGIDEDFLTYVPFKMTSGRLDWLEQKIKEGILKFDTKIIFIDHLGFLLPILNDYDQEMNKNYSAYLGMICRQLKNIARNYNVIIFLCAHIRKTKEELSLEDLANSAGIGQESDLVFMLERQRVKNKYQTSGDIFTNDTIIKIVKNRPTGQTKIIKCQMINEKFLPLTKIYDDQRIS
jgi:replicative DNA helicase